MAHKRKLKSLGTVEEVILYRQSKPFTKKEVKKWEQHYNTKLKVIPVWNDFLKPSRKEWILVER